MTHKFNPDYAIAPGETLEEILDFNDMPVFMFVKKTGLDKDIINGILIGKEPITEDIANIFEKVLGVPAKLWLNLEKNYRERLKEKLKSET